jgi:hypothetical protein
MCETRFPEQRTPADRSLVYSGPGGKFKAHIDTQRGQDQFGSLIVCLPSAHQGMR